MTTTTTKKCDSCNAEQAPSDRENWGILQFRGRSYDICSVCIVRMRGGSATAYGPGWMDAGAA